MRASRLLSLLLLLQTRGRMTAPELAAALEVSVRTVYRDVESLSAAGVPVYADRGPAGGYQLVDGYRTRLTGLSGDEAESLFFAGMPGPAAELGLGSVLAAAQLKLIAALPEDLRSRVGAISQRFHLDAPGWFRGERRHPHLGAIAAAVWEQHRLRVTYQRWDSSEIERVLEPLSVVLKAGTWYAVARADGQVRTYRVSRVLSTRELPEHFQRPDDFDLPTFWAAWSQRLEDSLFRGEATVRLSPRGRELLFLLGPRVLGAFHETAQPPDGDGWVRAVLPIESEQHALHAFLQLGADIEVFGPESLREAVRNAARAMVGVYA